MRPLIRTISLNMIYSTRRKIMPKFKQLTLEQKESIIQLRQNGLRIYEIAKKLNRNRNTIAYKWLPLGYRK